MNQKDLKEQFLQGEKQEKENTEVELGELAQQEEVKQSRFIVFLIDTLEEFENKHRGTAGCFYAIFLSALIALFINLRNQHYDSLPFIEIAFVSTLLMFIINFHLITNSNILPYVKDDHLNTVAKKSGISFLISVVCLISSLQYGQPQIPLFFFLSSWIISGIFEIYLMHENYDRQEMFLSLFTLGGSAFALDLPQIILLNYHQISCQSITFACIAGISMVFCADTFRQLSQQNLFTITHILGLLSIIFLPLFFPIEGLQSPTIMDWIFFLVVSLLMLLSVPIMIKAFAVERQTVVLHFMNWVLPFHLVFRLIFTGQFPSLLQVIAGGVIAASTIIIIQFQKVKIHSGSFYLEKEQANPERPKQNVELDLWKP